MGPCSSDWRTGKYKYWSSLGLLWDGTTLILTLREWRSHRLHWHYSSLSGNDGQWFMLWFQIKSCYPRISGSPEIVTIKNHHITKDMIEHFHFFEFLEFWESSQWSQWFLYDSHWEKDLSPSMVEKKWSVLWQWLYPGFWPRFLIWWCFVNSQFLQPSPKEVRKDIVRFLPPFPRPPFSLVIRRSSFVRIMLKWN